MGQAVARISDWRERRALPKQGIDAGRVDLYSAIHKGLRSFMAETLVAAGRMDPLDDADTRQTLEQVRALLDFCRGHLEHENDFVHRALEARRSGSAAASVRDHAAHREAIDALEGDASVVELASGDERRIALLRLYRDLALFVAENLEHMHVEETENNAVLWATHTDEELKRIHVALLASIAPQIMETGLRWMLPALSPAERAAVLGEMQRKAPAPVFERALGIALPRLGERERAKLLGALAPAPQPA